ncbi:uncharacterized [Tachysurus ichikawai]
MRSQSSQKQHNNLLIKVLTMLNLEQEDQPGSVTSLLRRTSASQYLQKEMFETIVSVYPQVEPISFQRHFAD